MIKKLAVAALCTTLTSHIVSAKPENPYNQTKIDRLPASVVQEFKRFDFLESIKTAADGSIYTTNLFKGTLYKVKNGRTSIIFKTDGLLAGLAWQDNNTLLITGADKEKRSTVHQVNVKTGSSKLITSLPAGGMLNGITRLNSTTFLIADSFKGAIWKLDLSDNSLSIWLEDDLLKRPSEKMQNPGANGIKLHNNAVYVNNTVKMLMVKIPLKNNGMPGTPKIIKENVFIDDFEIGNDGSIYGATHIFDNVVKIDPKGNISIIAQSDQGVAGPACVTWEDDTKTTLLVSTDGGMLSSTDKANAVPAKIVRLELPSIKTEKRLDKSSSRYAKGTKNLETISGKGAEADLTKAFNSISPDLGKLVLEYGFGDIYDRPTLDFKTKEMAIIANMIATGAPTAQLTSHMNAALHVGCTTEEIKEIIIQMSVYAGFPKANNAIFIFKGLLEKRAKKGISDKKGRSVSNPTTTSRYKKGVALANQLNPKLISAMQEEFKNTSPDLTRLVTEYEFGDVLSRPGLNLKTRELITIAALTGMGNAKDQLKFHIHAGLNNGLTKEEIAEVMILISLYSGMPSAINGTTALKEITEK